MLVKYDPPAQFYQKASDAVDVPGYKGIEVEKEKVEKVTDKALNDAVQNRIKGQMQYKEVKGAAKDNYRVNIDYTGKKNGKSFAGGSAKGYTLTLGSNQFIKDLENGIVGMKKGQKKTFYSFYSKEKQSGEDQFKNYKTLIAGSPRNAFRCSVAWFRAEVELLGG